ncbi:three-prime repair exonuclease 1-like isoform X2 [Prorops nasuta]|uniref:three-prime repair exonuclease 1-like isoform X2 n=1 Tax=Prorops nasuta TaxID=863751 RepID=UPI0034CEE38D
MTLTKMIQTFIFLDLETTGLIINSKYPLITEISLIAVGRDAFCEENVKELPRVLHKIVLPVNPNIQIPENVQKITNLTNNNLKKTNTFDIGVCEILTNFLNRFEKPACFVAHNGNSFDYPIFINQILSTNQLHMLEGVLCIDSLELFKYYFNSSYLMDNSDQSCNKPANYRLGTLYEHILGNKPENTHSAEGDCLNLLKCAFKLTDFFLKWSDEKAVPVLTLQKKLSLKTIVN